MPGRVSLRGLRGLGLRVFDNDGANSSSVKGCPSPLRYTNMLQSMLYFAPKRFAVGSFIGHAGQSNVLHVQQAWKYCSNRADGLRSPRAFVDSTAVPRHTHTHTNGTQKGTARSCCTWSTACLLLAVMNTHHLLLQRAFPTNPTYQRTTKMSPRHWAKTNNKYPICLTVAVVQAKNCDKRRRAARGGGRGGGGGTEPNALIHDKNSRKA